MSYLVDTYALIEWLVKGNKNYEKYFSEIEKSEGFVTVFTLIEIYHKIYHNLGLSKADNVFDIVIHNFTVTKVVPEIIKRAGIFRSEMLKKKKDASYTDSINYATAEILNVKILTGDENFRGLPNVEFVK